MKSLFQDRNKALLIVLLSLLSCSKKDVDYNQLLGSWKMKDVVNSTGQDIFEKTTYYKNGTAISIIKVDNKVNDVIKFKYTINKEKNTFRLSYQNYSKEFSIDKLDKNEFNLKDLETSRIIRNIRVKD